MRLGLCIDGWGRTPLWRVEAVGAQAVSLPLVRGYDPSAYLQTLRTAGLEVLLVLGRDAVDGAADWRLALPGLLGRAEALARAGLVTQVALGQEPDDGWAGEPASDNPLVLPRGGVGSWALSAADLAELLYRAMQRLGGAVPLWLGGLSSGRTDWLARLDLRGLDGVLLHPYGSGDLGAWLDAAHAEIGAQGLAEQVSLGIGELGRSDQDLPRGSIADWLAATLDQLTGRGDVERCYVCCDSDLTMDGYGLFDAEERAKPSVVCVFRAGELLKVVGSTDPLVDPDEEPAVPEDEQAAATPLPWPPGLPLDAEALALALAPSAEADPDRLHVALSEVWPQAGPHLELYGVGADRAALVALVAAIWAATGGRFVQLREEARYDRCERLYGRGTEAGLVLGNRLHGDGHRYRARGLLPIRGRAAYEQYGLLLGLDLGADPGLLDETAVAVAVACALFNVNGLWAAARRGDYAEIGRVLDPGLNGYPRLVAAIGRLWAAIDRLEDPPEVDAPALARVFTTAMAQVGRPYRAGGSAPSGFDGGGLVAWAYQTALSQALPTDPDALAAWTRPIGPEQARAGDLVLYAYGDPSRAGAQLAHVGLVTERDDLVLDSRAGLGVGARAHIMGAVRRYRRVVLAVPPVASDVEPGDEDEAMWQARYEELLTTVERMADEVERERARLTVTRSLPRRPVEKEAKAQHIEYELALGRYLGHVEALLAAANVGLERVAGRLGAVRAAGETQPGTTEDASAGQETA